MGCFEQDQPKICGVKKEAHDMSALHIMYIIFCGCTAPVQHSIIKRRAKLVTKEYLDILNYFITKSKHPGYEGMDLPKDFPKPGFIKDKETGANVDNSI